MPIFELGNEIIFPDPALVDPSGILAVGGDLKPARLLQAYRQGVFPWFNEDDPVVWWSPDPRMTLFPAEIKVSHSMKKIMRENYFHFTFDEAFDEVILECRKQKRKGQKGTWITPEMTEAYRQLHRLGYAHSLEVWRDARLVGGLYGVSLGGFFAGESMFSHVANASKAALICLANTLRHYHFRIIDCQVHTPHLASMGAREISRERFLDELRASLEQPTLKGSWKNMSVETGSLSSRAVRKQAEKI